MPDNYYANNKGGKEERMKGGENKVRKKEKKKGRKEEKSDCMIEGRKKVIVKEEGRNE